MDTANSRAKKITGLLKSNTTSSRAIWFSAGTLLVRGISIFTAPIFTRALTPVQYGEFSLFTVWATILAIVCSLYTHGSIPVAHARLEKAQWRPYLSNIFMLSTASFAVFSGLVFCFSRTASGALQVQQRFLPLLIVYSFFQFVVNTRLSTLAQEKKPQRYFLLSLLVMALSIGLSILFVLRAQDKLMGRIYGQILPTACIGMALYVLAMRQGKSFFSARHWRFALAVSPALIFEAAFFLLPSQSNRLMLTAYGFADSAGIYSVAYVFGAILEDILLSFNMSWVPAYYEHLNAARYAELETENRRFAHTTTLLTLGFLLVCPEVYRLLVAPAFWAGIPLLFLVGAAAYARYLLTIPLNYMLYAKKTIWMIPASVTALLVNIGMNALLIPLLGGAGAALSTILAYLTLLGLLWAASRKFFPLPHRAPVGLYPLWVIGCLALCLLTPSLWWLRWALAAVCGGLLLRHIVRNKGFF